MNLQLYFQLQFLHFDNHITYNRSLSSSLVNYQHYHISPILRRIHIDFRNDIIQSVLINLKDTVNDDVLKIVEDQLIIQLNKYEIQKRVTDLSFIDNSVERTLRKYIATKRIEGKAESTLKRYYTQNIKLLQFINKPLHEYTVYDIRFYLAYRSQQNNLSNQTLDGMRRCYCSFFSWLTAEGFIVKNPCVNLKQIKCQKKIKKPFSSIELDLIREACCGSCRDMALIEFLYSTGCRVSEVSSLNISDVNMDTGECNVIGKGNKERIVYLTDNALLYLKNYLNSRTDYNEALFIGMKKPNRLSKNGIESLLHRIGNKANVTNVHPHRFRRTLATNLLNKGMSIQDVASILGHADLKTTQIYCYIEQNNVRNAYYTYAK